MKPVHQTITEAGKGNCLAACVASILEIPIDEIPDLQSGANWQGLCDFLAPRGLVPFWIRAESGRNLNGCYVGYSPPHVIICGKSPRRKCQHAIVAQPNGYGYRVAHDPHPDGGNLAGPVESVILFCASNPAGHREN